MDSTSIAAAAALATSVSVVSIELPLLRRLAVIDHPCERSSHATPTLRGGGVGVVLAVVVGLTVLDDTRAATGAVLLAGLGLGAIGLVEDVHGSRVSTRMAAHLLVAVTLVTLVGKPGLMIPLQIVAVVAFVNAFNFMDGVNGISGVSAGVIAGSYAVLNASREDGVRGPALVVALAAVGFLPWNAVRARLFLGDVGSYALGGMLVSLALATWRSGLPIEAAVAPLAVYLADTGSTLVRRVARGEEWSQPHRSHAYQRLVVLGWSHQRVTLVVGVVTVLCATLGAATIRAPVGGRITADLGILLLLAGYLTLPHFLATRQLAQATA